MMAEAGKFDTEAFFSGGAGMFLEYYDIVKPVYLYATLKLLITDDNYGIPVSILKNFSVLSLIEWYKNRSYINPLQQLDFNHCTDKEVLDRILNYELENDESLYTLSPVLNIYPLIDVYIHQHMSFEFCIYSKEYNPFIERDLETVFNGTNYTYLYGDLKDCIAKTSENFTYIFSNIELANEASQLLHGTCSHILVAGDYRYNYKDNFKTLKYDLNDMAASHPFIITGTTNAMTIEFMSHLLGNITNQEEIQDVTD